MNKNVRLIYIFATIIAISLAGCNSMPADPAKPAEPAAAKPAEAKPADAAAPAAAAVDEFANIGLG